MFTKNETIVLDDVEYVRLKEVLLYLQILGYIKPLDIDGGNVFVRVGNFSDFEKWHEDKVKEERKLSFREWKIAIASALVGGVIGLIPTIINLFK